MKVYIVEVVCVDGGDGVEAVFTTEKAAIKFVKEFNIDNRDVSIADYTEWVVKE